MLNLQEYLESHKEEIVNFFEDKVTKNTGKEVKIAGEIFDRLVNKLSVEMPFGSALDMTHLILANSLIYSLWCGWLSQAMVNKKESKFSPENVEQFKTSINQAFEIRQNYAKDSN